MKKGLLFFLNLRPYVKIARVCLIPAAFFLFFARGVFLMTLSAVIIGILLVISIIRTPSDDQILKEIQQFHDEFKKRVSSDSETQRYNEVKIIKGYQQKGRMRVKRQVGGETIYPCITDLAIARKGEDFVFYFKELNLLRKSESNQNLYSINPTNFRYTYEPLPNENAAILEFMLSEVNIHISILVESDYHLRDFLEMVKFFER